MKPIFEYLIGKSIKRKPFDRKALDVKHKKDIEFISLLSDETLEFFSEIMEEGPVNDPHIMMKYDCPKGRKYKKKAYGIYIAGYAKPTIREFGYTTDGEADGLSNGEWFEDITEAAKYLSDIVAKRHLR